jgi:Alpha/beta hydrolase domain
VPRMSYKKLFIGALLLAGHQLLQAAEPEPVLVPTPRANALESTAASRPFLAAARSQLAVNLAPHGYTEKEHLVRGLAGDGMPYVTRLLVRRPTDAGKFSGRVIVEVLHAVGQFETAPLWGFSWEHFLRRGDVWVGLTLSPGAVAPLQKFNAARYVALNLPADEAGGCGAAQTGGFAGEILAQVGALLRSSSKENPLLELGPQRLLAAGYAGAGDTITRFAVAPHRVLRLGNGDPIFDGYLNVSGLAAVSAACAEGLPRGVPFVSVLTESDISRAPDRHGGDMQSEGFRLLEIAGTDGARPVPAGAPVAADLAAAGVAAPDSAACREPLMDQALTHALNAVWQQIDELLLLKLPLASQAPGLPMPSGRRVAVGALPVCSAATGSLRFDVAELKRLYRTRAETLRSFGAAVDQAVQGRLLVKEDAAALKASAAKVLPPF